MGAIGDSIGGKYEGTNSIGQVDFDFNWAISDDTQLTLATCEAVYNRDKVSPEQIATQFLDWFNRRKLSGLGSSTLKALRELQLGGHWALVGRAGEQAAGNGAAMRIAPLAFKKKVDRLTIKDVCNITHKNDEAYVGALAVYYAILNVLNGNWTGKNDLIKNVIGELPDTKVRDRLVELLNLDDLTITEIGQRYKPTGYVVDSVSISLFAAQQIHQLGVKEIFTELIKAGGDTDTTCSMTGQLIGALLGDSEIPVDWLEQYHSLGITELIDNLVENWNE